MSAGAADTIVVEVAAQHDGMRLDAWLAAAIPDLSRSRAKGLIQAGAVLLDGAPQTEPKRPVRTGERFAVAIPAPEPAEPAAEAIPLDVVHEDADLIVVNKPPGLVVHPAAGNWTGTLVNALLGHSGPSLSGIGGISRPGIVHRLDKDTSGLMVVAKSDRAHQRLAAQFADHGRSGPLERAYLAVVWGVPQPYEGTIDAPVGRSSRNREKMEVKRSGGREAVTHYRVLERFGAKGKPPVASLVECRLETGRTHQIRVHMAAIGHPVVGDRAYGAGFATKAAVLPEKARSVVEAFPRQALHAAILGFEHPGTGEALAFEKPPPPDMADLIAAFRTL